MKKFVGDKWEHDDYGNIYTHIDNNRKNIACTWHSEHSPEESQANTRLIAAAPEMYKMLIEIKEFLSFEDCDYIYSYVGLDELLARIDGSEEKE